MITYTSVTPSWHAQAACRDRDPEALFPEVRKTVQEEIHVSLRVKRICVGCPVVVECLIAAFDAEAGTAARFGVFGGSTPAERELVADHQDRVPRLLAELWRQVGRSGG